VEERRTAYCVLTLAEYHIILLDEDERWSGCTCSGVQLIMSIMISIYQAFYSCTETSYMSDEKRK
jgi:hypothetical protein